MDEEDLCPNCGSKHWQYIEYCYEDYEELTMLYCNNEYCDYHECIGTRNIEHLLPPNGNFNGVESS